MVNYQGVIYVVFLMVLSYFFSKNTNNGNGFYINFIQYFGLMMLVYIVVSAIFNFQNIIVQEKKIEQNNIILKSSISKIQDETIENNVTLMLKNYKDTINVGNVKVYDDYILILKDSSKIFKSKIVWMKSEIIN